MIHIDHYPSFLTFFYILEQHYIQSKSAALGAFLGAISPELWADRLPADKAILCDWEKFCKKKSAANDTILQASHDFISYYEEKYELGLGATIEWLNQVMKDPTTSSRIIENAAIKARRISQ